MEGIEEHKLFNPDKLYLLYRRSEPQYIKALYEKGEVYINTIDYIRTCDENAERSDPDDGILSREFWGEGTVTFGPPESDMGQHGPPFYTNNLVMSTDHIDTEKGNIYCLTGIYGKLLLGKSGKRPNLEFNTDPFGKSLIVIHNPGQFIERILRALKERGFNNTQCGPVEYYPDEYSGKVGFFKKHERFAYQNEFRIFVPNKINKAINLEIGSIEDISCIENNTILTLTYTDDKEQIITIG